jgi:nitrogen-specific signal transduction histidine kinase
VAPCAGQATGLVCVFKEPTRSRELEQRFLEAQRLEMTGRLAGGLAHDLKNVLSAIKGYAIVAGDAKVLAHERPSLRLSHDRMRSSGTSLRYVRPA